MNKVDDGFILVSKPAVIDAPRAIERNLEKLKETAEAVADRARDLQQRISDILDETDSKKFVQQVIKGGAVLAFSTMFPCTAVVAVPAATYVHGKLVKKIEDATISVTLHTQSSE